MTAEEDSLREALHKVELGSLQWQPWARRALRDAATRWPELTSDHVWRVLIEHRIPFPREGRAMAPVMLAGKRLGWISPTERFETVPSPATGRHPGPQRVYISHIVGATGAIWPETPAPRLTPAEPQAEQMDAPLFGASLGPSGSAPASRGAVCPICGTVLGNLQILLDDRYVTGRCPMHGLQTVKR